MTDDKINEDLKEYRVANMTVLQLMALIAVSGLVLTLVLRYLTGM